MIAIEMDREPIQFLIRYDVADILYPIPFYNIYQITECNIFLFLNI